MEASKGMVIEACGTRSRLRRKGLDVKPDEFALGVRLTRPLLWQCSVLRQPTVVGASTTDMMADLSLAERRKVLTEEYMSYRKVALEKFASWSDQEQVDFVKTLIGRMCHAQHGQIDSFLKPILQRDFITLLPMNVAEIILSQVEARWLRCCERVSRSWRRVVAHRMLWRKLIERKVRTDPVWRGIAEKRAWMRFIFISKECAHSLIYHEKGWTDEAAEKLRGSLDSIEMQHRFYRDLYPIMEKDIEALETNWQLGNHVLSRINCHSEQSKGVYCLQYDDEKIVSGLRDNTIKIWRRDTLQCMQTLRGHTGSVLCLQYDERVIISGSSDTTVRVWDVNSGEELHTLIHHAEAVLHLRSKDRSIAVWDMVSPKEINLRRILVGHRAAVNVVDFDQTYIVSASGDRTIKVWSADTCEFVRTLNGHKRGIACLQYRDRLVVSGSSDNTIRLWDIELGTCLRVLTGHEDLVRCIRFDSKRIVSGAYDGKIKIWDMQAALDPQSPPERVYLRTLVEHTGRVFRLQFDEFQIVSSSHDDTILLWDFLNPRVEGAFSDGFAASESSHRSQVPFPPLASSSPMNNADAPPEAEPSENEEDAFGEGARMNERQGEAQVAEINNLAPHNARHLVVAGQNR
ncbi:unnamed protein product [Toxocara canis]|uniref:F-box domain-containing protein n=1 Tax=Toxocara canis TaxID=6265 RepID=A0A183UBD5_TOXCA|nr:unnamed protein product [Toxocara canis]